MPATTAATPTLPARTMNERRDQSGIVPEAEAPVAAPAGRSGDTSQSSTHSPTPTETAAETATIAGDASGSPRAARKPSTPNAPNPMAASS